MAQTEPYTSPQDQPPIGPQLHYIDGQFRAGLEGETFFTDNPSDGTRIAEAAAGTAVDVDLAVAAARRAFEEDDWPHLPASERARWLRKIADAVRGDAERLVELEVLDIGMPIRQMRLQADRAARNFDYFASMITSLDGRSHGMGSEFLNYSRYKPIGVAGLITPWNSPLMLASWKIAPCLAAGNTCVLKPAEWSPLTATRFAELVDAVGLPPGVFNVVHGIGEVAGAALVAHPDVRLVSFTGETSTGATIMANGAPTLTRCSFELGGKSPVVVFDDCDFERAVDGVVFQIFSMNGQRCTAGSRLLVQDGIYEDFTGAVAERAQAIRVGDPFSDATELGPLIRPEHYARVQALIASAHDDGARLLAGGVRPAGLERGNYLEATLFRDVHKDSRIFQEEVFGPVLVAAPFTDEAEAVRLANASRYGLAAYVWTENGPRSHRVAHAMDSGMVWVNSQNVRDLEMPFGGSKDSGMGREGGHYSFEFFGERQTIHYALGGHQIPRLGIERRRP